MSEAPETRRRKLSPTFGADRGASAAAAVFVGLLLLFEAFYFRESYRGLAAYLAAPENAVFSVICVGYLAVTVYLQFLLVLFILSSRWRWRVPLIAVFAVAMFAQFGYQNALGRFLVVQDFVSMFSATSEQKLDSISEFSSLLPLVPVTALVAGCLWLRNRERVFGFAGMAALTAAHALFYVNLAFVNPLFFDQRFASGSVQNFFLAAVDYAVSNRAYAMTELKRPGVAKAVAPDFRPANNIVFVFDESIRGDHLSLNGYHRQTTPYLEKLAAEGLLANFGLAVSASTLSHTSYDAVISGATPNRIEELGFHRINGLPSVFQFARAMNYRTHLIDGQMKRYWGGIPEDLKDIDNFVSLADIDSPDRVEDWELGDEITNEDNRRNRLKQWEIDLRIAEITRRIYESSTGNFIFIYKRGAHFPYEKNYPEEETFWKPIYRFKQQYEIPPADKIDAVRNSYDNSIRYNLDSFFRALADDYAQLPNATTILYTADHGESFYANGRAGHGGDAPEEAIVPFFVLGAERGRFDTGYRVSHANVLPTLLDLMNFPAGRPAGYAASLFEARREHSLPRFYNPPTGRRLPFDK